MVTDDQAREVIDAAAQWARDRHEMRATLGAVADCITGETEDGHSIATLPPELVDSLHRWAS